MVNENDMNGQSSISAKFGTNNMDGAPENQNITVGQVNTDYIN